MNIQILSILLILILLLNLTLSLNPYRKCGHNPLYTSNSLANYMFAMPLSFIQDTDSLIYYNVKHYGFKLKNFGLNDCSNFFLSNTSCCNTTTLSKVLNHTKVVYESYGNITKAPVFSLAKDLVVLLNGTQSGCLYSNGTLNNLLLPGVNSKNSTGGNANVTSAYAYHDGNITQLISLQKTLIRSQSCLLCLATQDWDYFLTPSSNPIYSTSYYQSLLLNYTTLLTNLNSSSNTLKSYIFGFMSTNLNQSKCSTLYTNYTTRLANANICTSGLQCGDFAKKYFGQFLIPGVVWKMYRMYLNRSDAVAGYEEGVMGGQGGFKGNVSYVVG